MSRRLCSAEVVIPWRDRGTDPLRELNLMRVLQWWEEFGASPYLASDGRHGDEQFNRSAAYNAGMKICHPDTDVYVFAEADILVDSEQIDAAVLMAYDAPGLVIPFDEYRYLPPEDSMKVLRCELDPADAEPQWTMPEGRSIGSVNVVSRKTMDAVGQWDETFDGSWFDDNAMKIAFDVCAAPTRWVTGPAFHLHHLPGWQGDHLTSDDKAATRRNKRRLRLYQSAMTPERIRELTAGGQ